MTKSARQLDDEITAILARSTGEKIALPSPPPSVRTDRQRRNWYWRRAKTAREHATATARLHGAGSRAYRDADAVADAYEREWQWYSALLHPGED